MCSLALTQEIYATICPPVIFHLHTDLGKQQQNVSDFFCDLYARRRIHGDIRRSIIFYGKSLSDLPHSVRSRWIQFRLVTKTADRRTACTTHFPEAATSVSGKLRNGDGRRPSAGAMLVWQVVWPGK